MDTNDEYAVEVAVPAPVTDEALVPAAEWIGVAEGAFGVMPEVVAGALRHAGLAEGTRSQVAAAVAVFMTAQV